MKIKLILVALGIIVAGAAAYFLLKPKNSRLIEYVPSESMAIIKVDLPELAKVFQENQTEIKKTTMWKKFLENQDDPMGKLIQNILKDPQASGVDFSEKSFLFFQNTKRGNNVGILLGLKNKSAFAAMVKSNSPAGKATGSESGIDYAEFSSGTYISYSNDVILITNQMGESKEYFTNILNKKTSTKDGDFFKNQMKNQNGLISGGVNIDAIFQMQKTSRGMDFMEEIKNPFPNNTAMVFNMDAEKGKIGSSMKFVSKNQSELEKLNFFKDKGVMGKYENSIFSSGTPYMAAAISMDMNKLFDFISIMIPKFKTMRSEESIKDAENSLTGDFCMGMSINKKAIEEQKKAMENMDYSSIAMSNPYNIVLKFGLKDGNKLIEKYGALLRKNEDGFYEINALFFHAYLMIENNTLSISMDQEYMKTLKSTGKGPSNDFKLPDNNKNSAVYMAVNGNGISAMMDIFGAGNKLKSLNKSFFTGIPISYLKGGEMLSDMEMSDKKTHPVLQYIYYIDEMMKFTEEQQKKMQERIMRNNESNEDSNSEPMEVSPSQM